MYLFLRFCPFFFFSDELQNFLERMGVETMEELDDHGKEELRDWASFRGQTLSRTGELLETVTSFKTYIL